MKSIGSSVFRLVPFLTSTTCVGCNIKSFSILYSGRNSINTVVQIFAYNSYTKTATLIYAVKNALQSPLTTYLGEGSDAILGPQPSVLPLFVDLEDFISHPDSQAPARTLCKAPPTDPSRCYLCPAAKVLVLPYINEFFSSDQIQHSFRPLTPPAHNIH